MANRVSRLIIEYLTVKKGEGEKETAKEMDGLAGSLGKTVAQYATLGAVIGVATAALKYSINEAKEAEVVQAKLEAVLRSTKGAAGLTANELDNYASSLSRLTGIDDEVIKNAEAMMLTFTQVGKQVFPDAMTAALDMSAVLDQDLKSSVIMIGKALNVSAGDTQAAGLAMTAMRRVGVALTTEQVELAKQLVATGDVMGYQKLILDELNTEFGGAAEMMGNTAVGAGEKLKNAFGNLGAAIGNHFLPAITRAQSKLAEFIETAADGVNQRAEEDRWLNIIAQSYGMTWEQLQKGIGLSDEFAQKVKDEIAYLQQLEAADQAWIVRLQGGQEALAATGQAVDEYAAALDDLQKAIDGPVGDAVDEHNKKMEEYREQLREAKSEEDRRNILDKIQAETAAYEQRALSIAFNIAQEQILNSEMSGEEKAQAISALAESYGLVDEKTRNLMDVTASWVGMLARGEITQEQFNQRLGDAAKGIMGVEEAGQALDLSEAEEGMDNTAEAAHRIKNWTEGAKGALIALDGVTADAYVNIHVSGGVPNLGQMGTKTNYGYGSGFSEFAEGGFLGENVAIVGERGWEAIYRRPDGKYVVLPHDISSWMQEAGLLGNVPKYGYGGTVEGPYIPGPVIISEEETRSESRDIRERSDRPSSTSTATTRTSTSTSLANQIVTETITPLTEATEMAVQSVAQAQAQQTLEARLTRALQQQGNDALVGEVKGLRDDIRSMRTEMTRATVAAVQQVMG